MGLITQILNQLVDHQHRGPIHSPDELGAGAARARPIPILHSFLLLFFFHFLEITKRISGLSGRGEDSFFFLYRGAVVKPREAEATNRFYRVPQQQLSLVA